MERPSLWWQPSMTAVLANLFIKFSEFDVFITFNQLSNVLRDRTREDLVFHCRSLNGILSSFAISRTHHSNDLVFTINLAYLLSISSSFDSFPLQCSQKKNFCTSQWIEWRRPWIYSAPVFVSTLLSNMDSCNKLTREFSWRSSWANTHRLQGSLQLAKRNNR